MDSYVIIANPAIHGGFHGELKVEISFFLEFIKGVTRGIIFTPLELPVWHKFIDTVFQLGDEGAHDYTVTKAEFKLLQPFLWAFIQSDSSSTTCYYCGSTVPVTDKTIYPARTSGGLHRYDVHMLCPSGHCIYSESTELEFKL